MPSVRISQIEYELSFRTVNRRRVLPRENRMRRHREFLDFLRHVDASVPKALDVHLIIDKYAIHKHPRVQCWLAARPRYHV